MSFFISSKLPLGKIVVTQKAQERLSNNEVNMALLSHLRGDEGDLDEYANRNPERYALDGCRRLSVYRTLNGARFWVLTEADGSLTTVLLPEDYLVPE